MPDGPVMDALMRMDEERKVLLKNAEHEIEELKMMLFNACVELEKRGGFESWEEEQLSKWWKKRQMEERQEHARRRTEAMERKRLLAEQALSKLTPEERKALGL